MRLMVGWWSQLYESITCSVVGTTASSPSLPLPDACAAAAAFVLGAGREGRPHQVDAVAKLMSLLWLDRHVAETRPINYLVQHATGTGKSLTIAVLALQLLCFCTDGTFLRRTDSEEDGVLAAEQQGGRGDGDASRGGGGGGGARRDPRGCRARERRCHGTDAWADPRGCRARERRCHGTDARAAARRRRTGNWWFHALPFHFADTFPEPL